MYRNRALDIRHRERSDLALIVFSGFMFDWDKCVVFITYELTFLNRILVSSFGGIAWNLSGSLFFGSLLKGI